MGCKIILKTQRPPEGPVRALLFYLTHIPNFALTLLSSMNAIMNR